MMNYEMFKEALEKELWHLLPDDIRKMDMSIEKVKKVNRIYDGIIFKAEGTEPMASPTVYVDDIYERYQKEKDFDAILQDTAHAIERGFELANDINPSLNLDDAKDNIVFQLINTEQNKEMLSDMPHREFQDLSIIYRWVLKIEDEGIQSTVVHNSLADKLGLSEEQLYQLAAENTKRLLPPTVRTMQEVMRDMFAKEGMPIELADDLIEGMPADHQMWIISNSHLLNGAISMLYDETLHDVAENIGEDLYILPSSVHEVIAVSTDISDPKELAAMVQDINMEQVALEERLSNQVYHYDKDLRTLSLATDTPNKRLDGKVAEVQMIYETKEKAR